VSFEVRRGTVHALCGENGAGKSTLMKIIDGIYQPDEGAIQVNGREVKIRNPIEAQQLRIAMIGQELHHVPEISVAENFFIGRLPVKAGRVDWKRIKRSAKEILDAEGLDYRPSQKLSSLTVSGVQLLEILKAVHHKAEIIIMDEPTSAIAQRDIDRLFAQIRTLKAKGVSIIYISHKIDEVFEIADDITVLRDGNVVGTGRAENISPGEVISKMVGRKFDQQYPKEALPVGDVVLRATDLSRENLFEDINLEVRAGEIVGVAGLIGAGRSEVVQAIFGLDKLDSGTVEVNGSQVDASTPAKAIAAGLAMLSEDRRLAGIIPQLSIKKNATLASLKKVIYKGRSWPKAEEKLVKEYFTRMNVKAPSLETPIGSLSGGNQQKVLLSRWLITDPAVMLLDEPTRGIDVGAKYEIYRLMTEFAAQGRGVLMISSELPELIGMCDRIYVMSSGRLTAELRPEQYSQEAILRYAMSEIVEGSAT